MRWINAALALLVVLLLLSWGMQVFAQQAPPLCVTRDEARAWLAEHHDELPVIRAATSRGELLEAYVSDAGTFSLLLTNPRGCSRIAVVGRGWTDDSVIYDAPSD